MTRKKLIKFGELTRFPNFIDKPIEKIDWGKQFFFNSNPITLELGCGKGEYTIRLAQAYPDCNFIGIDLKGVRLWRGAKDALDAGLKNVLFLRANIREIENYFREGEISEIWIPFPDPYPQPAKWKKRLVSSVFLEKYNKILKDGGLIHLKTDNTELYKFALRTINDENHRIICQTNDLYTSELADEYTSIPTYFEGIFKEKGEKIKYIRFGLQYQ